MSSLAYWKCENSFDDKGDRVLVVPTFLGINFYIDKESLNLSHAYKSYSVIGWIKLGCTGLESFAE